ncbi:MAG: class I SAM-dependent methyltransferase [Dehalococcoidales bacterium]|jgi:SAM-dependent methyltransferase
MNKIVKPTVKSKGWDWSKVSEDYWSVVSDEFLPVALRWQELGKKTVLDIGCGRGRHSLFLAELGFDVTAEDLSPEGIEELKQAAKKRKLDGKIKTVVCDMLEMPFPGKSFDCVLGFHSIFHTDYAGLEKIISQITRMLKQSGRLYITFNSKDNPSFRAPDNVVVDEYTVIRHHGIEQGVPHTFVEYDDIVRLLADYNILKIQQIQDYFEGLTSIHFFVEAEKKN